MCLSRPRLPARDARRRAHVRRDGRAVSRGADLHAALRRAGTGGRFAGRTITHLAAAAPRRRARRFRRLLPLYPCGDRAAASCPTATLVLTSSSAFAHGVRAPAGARARLLLPCARSATPGTSRTRALREAPRAAAPRLLRLQLRRMRRWDLAASRARRRLHRQLAADPRADQALLRPRRADRPSAGRDRALRARRPRRRAAGRLRARAPQARRTSRSRRPAAPARRSGSSARAPTARAAARPTREAEFLGRVEDARAGRALRERARAWSCRAWRSSGSPPSRRRRPGDR